MQQSAHSSHGDSAASAVSEALGGVLGNAAAARAARQPRTQAHATRHAQPGTRSGLQPPQTHQPLAPSLAGFHRARLPIPILGAAPSIQSRAPTTPASAERHSQPRCANKVPQSATRAVSTEATTRNALRRTPSTTTTTTTAATAGKPATRSPSVVKIDIPPLLEANSAHDTWNRANDAEPPLPAMYSQSHDSGGGAGRDHSEFRRRKSIQKPPASPQRTGDASNGQHTDSKLKQSQPAASVSPRGSASAALHYTSAFLRRKQPFLDSEPSSRADPSPSTGAGSSDPRFTNRLFFQSASEQSQSIPPSLASSSSIGADLESSSTAPDTETDDSESALKKKARQPKGHSHARGKTSAMNHSSGAKSSGDDSHSKQPLDRIGELSREVDEFDFAILLKPSKYEEHLDLHQQQSSDMHHSAAATSSSTAPEVTRDASGSIVPPAPAPLEPAASHLRRLKPKHDPTRARNLIITRITRTGLQVKRLLSLDGKQTLLKVKAPQPVLELGAERLKLRKLRKFDQIWMEFSRELRTTFADFDEALGGVRFIDSEKQSIVHALLTTSASDAEGVAWSLGAGLNEFCPLKIKYVVQMFPLHKQDLGALKKHWVTYWREPLSALSGSALGSSSSGSADSGSKTASCGHRLVCEALTQPINQVAQYFGEKVAFYFAWMELYTRWLVVPSAVGLVLFSLQVSSQRIDHPLAPLYAMFMALWTSAFLIAWKRRASALAYRWGTLGYEEDAEATRPEFYGDPAISTPELKAYPAWKRCAKYLVTIPTVLGSMALTMAITFIAFSTRDRLERSSLETKARAKHLAQDISADLAHGLTLENLKRLSTLGLDWQFWFYFLITPMLYGLLIPVLDFVFTKWARAMTSWENHRTESRYHSHLILKVFSFRFVHVFASLYYYAFVDYARTDNLLRVAIQLASFMVAGQLWKNVMETLYPFVRRRWHAQQKKKLTNAQFSNSTVFNLNALSMGGGASTASAGAHRRRSDALAMARASGWMAGAGASGASASAATSNSNAVIHEQCVRLEQASDKAWEEAALQQYDTFEDYTEMLIQFGYVSFFSLAFPLAPLLALLNNVFELRTDAFKLCHAKQRPIAHKASGIGIWFHVLQLMSVLAVLTNCLHIAFTTTLLERLLPQGAVSAQTKVWLAFGVEHLLLALKVAMMAAIPAMPRDVQRRVRVEREQAKQESARAMAARMLLLAAEAAAAATAAAEAAAVTERQTTDEVGEADDGEAAR